jgi:hypothetical protein
MLVKILDFPEVVLIAWVDLFAGFLIYFGDEFDSVYNDDLIAVESFSYVFGEFSQIVSFYYSHYEVLL